MSTPSDRKSPAAGLGEGPRTGRRRSGASGDSTAVSPFESDAWLGRVVDDRYRIERLLGEGGMGAVFLAEHLKLQKKVALKIILPQFAGDGEIAERFAREAMASAKLDHPHVASALDYGTLAEGGAYLVMQFVPGRSLRDAALERAGDWRWVCEVGAQIADALAAAHAAGIVHRDLKPDNVFLERREGSASGGSELVRVLDFGIARVLGDDVRPESKKQLTRVGTIIGTPGYMAPEQALGEVVDERADLYALGVVLWEVLAGRSLFPDEDITAIVTKQLTTEAPPLDVPGLPVELGSLISRLLARDRQMRPQRAIEVRELLRRLTLESEFERMSVSTSGQLTVLRDAAARDSIGREASGVAVVEPRASISTDVSRAGQGIPLQLVGLLLAMLLGVGATILVIVVALVRAPDTAPVATGPAPGPLASDVAPPVPDTTVEVPPPALVELAAPVGGASAGLGEDFDALLYSTERSARTAAANRIVSSPAGGPEVARLAADIELAERCSDRRSALTRLRELGDPRALPLMDRLDALPRRGCGFLNTQDCWRCIRGDIRRTRAALSPPDPAAGEE
jgi:serine/threonine-protein kinase